MTLCGVDAWDPFSITWDVLRKCIVKVKNTQCCAWIGNPAQAAGDKIRGREREFRA